MSEEIPLLRDVLGESLRAARVAQGRTLREISTAARVSLGYLSEVERGRKEPSSELLHAICKALDIPTSALLYRVAGVMARAEAKRVTPAHLQSQPVDMTLLS